MGGVFSKPKIPQKSQAELDAEKKARESAAKQEQMLITQREEEDRVVREEQTEMQRRRRGRRYGGPMSLLAQRENPEMGIKKGTLG